MLSLEDYYVGASRFLSSGLVHEFSRWVQSHRPRYFGNGFMHQELDNSHEKEYAAILIAQSRLKVAFTGAVLPTCLSIYDILRSLGVGIWERMDLLKYPNAIIEDVDDLINNLSESSKQNCEMHYL